MNRDPLSIDYSDKSGLAYYWLEENIGRVLLVVLFLWLGIWGLALEGQDDLSRGQLFIRGMGPELAGIVIGVVAIDFFNERRQMQQLKSQLIRQMGSNIKDVAVPAVRELAHHGWLYDGSLRRINLRSADLRGANMRRAVLSGANLYGAKLQSANMESVDLSGAKLDHANLENSNLTKAILKKAKLSHSYLTGAKLSLVDFSEADLWDCDLRGALLHGANLSAADMRLANLDQIEYWSIHQLRQASSLEAATMPDRTQLGGILEEIERGFDGPTFDEWKASFLSIRRATIYTEFDYPPYFEYDEEY